MKISILGAGCAKCKKLADNAEAAASALGVEYTLEKVTDIKDIMAYKVMMTPALVVDGKVVSVGKAPGADEIKTLLTAGSDASMNDDGNSGAKCCCGGNC